MIEIRGLPGTDVPGYIMPLLRSWTFRRTGVSAPTIVSIVRALCDLAPGSRAEVKIPTLAQRTRSDGAPSVPGLRKVGDRPGSTVRSLLVLQDGVYELGLAGGGAVDELPILLADGLYPRRVGHDEVVDQPIGSVVVAENEIAALISSGNLD